MSACVQPRRSPVAQLLSRSLLVATAALGATGFTTSPAHAVGREETLAAALQKFDSGRKAFEAGQFEEALSDFKTSLELLPSPNTRLYIGRCYRAIGRVASAQTALKLAAREASDRQAASGEKRYGATADAANQEAAELEPKVPRLTVVIPPNPPAGLVVKVDGKELPPAAWGLASETDPGTVTVEMTGPRIVPFKQDVKLAEGAKERLEIPVTRLPTATLAVHLKNLPSGVAISLDGRPVDVATIETPRDLDVGPHALVVTAPGYIAFKWDKVLADKDSESVDVTLAVNPLATGGGGFAGTPKWMFYAAGGGAVVALGIATGLGVNAYTENNAQEALLPGQRSASVKSSIQSQSAIANGLFIGGGVLGIGAVVLGFTTHWKSGEKSPASPPTTVSFAPWGAPDGAGLGATGSF